MNSLLYSLPSCHPISAVAEIQARKLSSFSPYSLVIAERKRGRRESEGVSVGVGVWCGDGGGVVWWVLVVQGEGEEGGKGWFARDASSTIRKSACQARIKFIREFIIQRPK